MTDAAGWLDRRDPPAPPAVRVAMDRLLAEAGGDVLHDHLAAAALRGLDQVVAQPSDRNAAPALLAVDALLTYACEAAAEAGPEELDRLTRRLNFERFSELLPRGS